MAMIFWFSSKTADQSGEMSNSLTHSLFGFVQDWDTGENGDKDRSEAAAGAVDIMNMLEVLVRKSAHFVIFFILGFCAANTLRQITENKKYIFRISAGWSSFYAATDEWHQYFVPGRSCMWQDWVIDTAGALCGIGAAFFIVWVMANINKHRQDKQKTGGFDVKNI